MKRESRRGGDDYWKVDGLCQELPDAEADFVFFPPHGGSTDEARSICYRCPVRVLCAAYAIAHREPYGVWGGLSAHERKHMPRDKARAVRRFWFDVHPDALRHM